MRARFSGFESQPPPVDMISSATSRCQLRLAQQGNGPVQKVVVGLFVHMLARAGQRGSRRRQTGAMVCRLRVRTAGLSASIIQKPKDGEDRKIVTFVRWWPPFYDSDGPGEALNGSVRPRWASLRPDGVRTVPTARARNPRRGKGVNLG